MAGLESENMEDWQWVCLVQVVVSTILYVWKEPNSLVRNFSLLIFGCVNRVTKKYSINGSDC